MNASPIKSEGSCMEDSYWRKILDLKNLMNSKVYTYGSESLYSARTDSLLYVYTLEFIRFLSIQLFKSYENHYEGLPSIKKNKIISNVALFKLGCARKILRFIRNEPFDLKVGLIPSDNSQVYNFGKEFLMLSVKMCSRVPTSAQPGKVAALSFMKWIGMDIDFIDAPMLRHFIVNVEASQCTILGNHCYITCFTTLRCLLKR
ncbi:hypothetical protein H5410_000898 [Solanum commersonii]|uniref:Uncharacterized protein n=1 Tax=Solanum commersonii TaxID=4109 RepID=A0A9J6AX45_SOLCO|nr:hypothetical protein H5410_000898 [Solanum commersonii]